MSTIYFSNAFFKEIAQKMNYLFEQQIIESDDLFSPSVRTFVNHLIVENIRSYRVRYPQERNFKTFKLVSTRQLKALPVICLKDFILQLNRLDYNLDFEDTPLKIKFQSLIEKLEVHYIQNIRYQSENMAKYERVMQDVHDNRKFDYILSSLRHIQFQPGVMSKDSLSHLNHYGFKMAGDLINPNNKPFRGLERVVSVWACLHFKCTKPIYGYRRPQVINNLFKGISDFDAVLFILKSIDSIKGCYKGRSLHSLQSFYELMKSEVFYNDCLLVTEV